MEPIPVLRIEAHSDRVSACKVYFGGELLSFLSGLEIIGDVAHAHWKIRLTFKKGAPRNNLVLNKFIEDQKKTNKTMQALVEFETDSRIEPTRRQMVMDCVIVFED